MVAGMDFSQALVQCLLGHKITRSGWHGTDAWVAYSPGRPAVKAGEIWSATISTFVRDTGGDPSFLPYLMFKTSDGNLVPWTISHTDILASDWFILRVDDTPTNTPRTTKYPFGRITQEQMDAVTIAVDAENDGDEK